MGSLVGKLSRSESLRFLEDDKSEELWRANIPKMGIFRSFKKNIDAAKSRRTYWKWWKRCAVLRDRAFYWSDL